MTKISRLRRRIVRDRAAASRFTASLRKGRSLATHVVAAGVANPETVKGVANGLRSVAKRIGVEPAKVARTHRTTDGRSSRLRKVNHYTAAQVARIVAAYNPRKQEYKAALVMLVLSYGAPVTVRQMVRPVQVPATRELVNA